MALDPRTVEAIAELISGDDAGDDSTSAPRHSPVYRSGSELTRFFARAGIPRFQHDGSTRKWWVLECLRSTSGAEFKAIVLRLANPREYGGGREHLRTALRTLNRILAIEGMRVGVEGTAPTIERVPVDFSIRDDDDRELKPVPTPDFESLGLGTGLDDVLAFRWDEAQRCVNAEAYLAAVVVMGSLLEGMLLATIRQFPAQANRSAAAPKAPSTGKPLPFAAWTLSQMIDVAHDSRWIDLDVKRFSHALRDFRNLIHPNAQHKLDELPDADTCKMSWLVVQAATSDLVRVVSAEAAHSQ